VSKLPSRTYDLYKLAGIEDAATYSRERFFTGGVLDARYFDAVYRFDIRYARTMWIYDNVRRGAALLDIGCGEGVLALLKRKGVTLTGVDISPDLLAVARQNGYDATCIAQLAELPFPDASFDYVVSLDVLGHIAFDEKDAVLAEIKRVLRPDGVTLHGIETMNRVLHKGYDSMSEEELRRFISIDGHLGLEDEAETAARFRRFFPHVKAESRYTLCLSVDEILKQSDAYGVPFDADFLDYLRGLSFNERRAFDMAMGYVFGKISDLDIKLPESGLYMLLKASSAPLGQFYNEHRDRSHLFASASAQAAFAEESICLDRSSRASFDNGWYAANHLPPVARWMGTRGRIRFRARSLSKLRLDLTTHMPELDARPLGLEFLLNEERICALSLFRHGWLELEIDVQLETRHASLDAEAIFELEIRADRTWQPSECHQGSTDDRQLSIAVCNIEIFL
jgi:ubiquinone/menaquinone biosynthesis C-methylase UbiE